MTDRELLKVYMQGFKDELYGREDIKFYITDSPYKSPAYKLGRLHGLASDEQTSLDYLSGEQIIKMIKDI